jgi:hypothetical protein
MIILLPMTLLAVLLILPGWLVSRRRRSSGYFVLCLPILGAVFLIVLNYLIPTATVAIERYDFDLYMKLRALQSYGHDDEQLFLVDLAAVAIAYVRLLGFDHWEPMRPFANPFVTILLGLSVLIVRVVISPKWFSFA